MMCGMPNIADAMEVLLLGFISKRAEAEFGCTKLEISLVASCVFFGMFWGSNAFGLLSDRIGRRKCFAATMIFIGFWGVMSALSPNVWVMMALRGLVGFGCGGNAGPMNDEAGGTGSTVRTPSLSIPSLSIPPLSLPYASTLAAGPTAGPAAAEGPIGGPIGGPIAGPIGVASSAPVAPFSPAAVGRPAKWWAAAGSDVGQKNEQKAFQEMLDVHPELVGVGRPGGGGGSSSIFVDGGNSANSASIASIDTSSGSSGSSGSRSGSDGRSGGGVRRATPC